jgi:hypothetical protein
MLLLQVIVVAFGALFTLLTSVLVFLDYRFGGSSHTSEQFSTAGECSMPCSDVGQHRTLKVRNAQKRIYAHHVLLPARWCLSHTRKYVYTSSVRALNALSTVH